MGCVGCEGDHEVYPPLLYDDAGGAELELTLCDTSLAMVLGGVRRLPTLAWLPAWPAPETAK